MALTRRQLSDPDCPVGDSDYEAIEAAIMETARGRWFLSEYARRHRHADTLTLLAAINSLHDSVKPGLPVNAQPARRAAYLVSTSVSATLPADPPANAANDTAPAAEPEVEAQLRDEDLFHFKV